MGSLTYKAPINGTQKMGIMDILWAIRANLIRSEADIEKTSKASSRLLEWETEYEMSSKDHRQGWTQMWPLNVQGNNQHPHPYPSTGSD